VNKGEVGGDVLNDGLWNLTWRVSNQLNYCLLAWLMDVSTFDWKKGGRDVS